jgi:hypothetical protein
MKVRALNKINYHGSDYQRGKKFIEKQEFIESIGDRHWLGNGCYFYEDDFYAYFWIENMCRQKYKCSKCNSTLRCINNKYMILTAEIHTLDERIFNLDSPLFKLEFDKMIEIILEKMNRDKKLDTKPELFIQFIQTALGAAQ